MADTSKHYMNAATLIAHLTVTGSMQFHALVNADIATAVTDPSQTLVAYTSSLYQIEALVRDIGLNVDDRDASIGLSSDKVFNRRIAKYVSNYTRNPSVWNQFTYTDNQAVGTTAATFDTRNGRGVLEFDASTVEYAYFVGSVPETATNTTNIQVNVLWMADTAVSGKCMWGAALEKLNASTDLDSDSFDTAATNFDTTAGTSGIATETSISVTAMDGLVAGDFYRLRIYRNATDATNDTMTGDAQVLSVEVRGT